MIFIAKTQGLKVMLYYHWAKKYPIPNLMHFPHSEITGFVQCPVSRALDNSGCLQNTRPDSHTEVHWQWQTHKLMTYSPSVVISELYFSWISITSYPLYCIPITIHGEWKPWPFRHVWGGAVRACPQWVGRRNKNQNAKWPCPTTTSSTNFSYKNNSATA